MKITLSNKEVILAVLEFVRSKGIQLDSGSVNVVFGNGEVAVIVSDEPISETNVEEHFGKGAEIVGSNEEEPKKESADKPKQKRKRRTKAEIEAAKEAESKKEETSSPFEVKEVEIENEKEEKAEAPAASASPSIFDTVANSTVVEEEEAPVVTTGKSLFD